MTSRLNKSGVVVGEACVPNAARMTEITISLTKLWVRLILLFQVIHHLVRRRGTLSSFQNRALWVTAVLLAPFLLLGIDYGIKVLTSVYKKDLGNGVVIYGDEYVKTGLWVFDCKYSRLINREPLPAPLAELGAIENFTLGQVLSFDGREVVSAKEAIIAITSMPEWYKSLQYVYSGLGESSRIDGQKFFMVADHAGRRWAIEVHEALRLRGGSRFTLTGRPYDPETYVDYTKAFEAAVKSCPAPQ